MAWDATGAPHYICQWVTPQDVVKRFGVSAILFLGKLLGHDGVETHLLRPETDDDQDSCHDGWFCVQSSATLRPKQDGSISQSVVHLV